MLVLAVKYLIYAGYEKQAIAFFRELAKEAQMEPGNILYLIHRSPTNPCCFFLYESYIDEAAFANHCTSAHFQQYVTQGLYHICERRDSQKYIALQEDV